MSDENRLRALMARQLKPLSAMMTPHRPARMITYSIPTIRLKPTFKKNPAQGIPACLCDAPVCVGIRTGRRRQVSYAQIGLKLHSGRKIIILTAKPALVIQMDIVCINRRSNMLD